MLLQVCPGSINMNWSNKLHNTDKINPANQIHFSYQDTRQFLDAARRVLIIIVILRKNLSLPHVDSLHRLQVQQFKLPLEKKKNIQGWKLSSDCQISLSNQKLCIQREQSSGLPAVQDFKALIMTLRSQLKQAFCLSRALEAGNPQKVQWTCCQTDGMTYWYLTSEPLHQGYLVSTATCLNTIRLIKKWIFIERRTNCQYIKNKKAYHLPQHKKLFFKKSSLEEQKILLILAPNKTWPPLCSCIKARWEEKKKKSLKVQLTSRGESESRPTAGDPVAWQVYTLFSSLEPPPASRSSTTPQSSRH